MNKCKNCAGAEFFYQISGPHLGQYCAGCKTWQKWMPQTQHLETMPFGKYKGQKINDIQDTQYLTWLLSNLKNDVINGEYTRLVRALENKLNQNKPI